MPIQDWKRGFLVLFYSLPNQSSVSLAEDFRISSTHFVISSTHFVIYEVDKFGRSKREQIGSVGDWSI